MTSEWFTWYGLRCGLSYKEAQLVPLTEVLDLIAIQQIKEEGFKYRDPQQSDQDALMELLSLR